MRFCKGLGFLWGLLGVICGAAHAAEWYVAPDGDDGASGGLEDPFATVQRAQREVSPGDTVFLGGGRYAMTEDKVARKRGIWAYVVHLDKSGEAERPIRYQAIEGERPVFDFSAVRPDGLRVHAFEVSGSHLELVGLEVTGVQVTMKGHTQSICFSNTGSHNRFERLSMHDGMGIGFYLSRGSNNLVLNCDAWNNYDPVSEGGKGGNVDGFGCHPDRGDTGNVFRGCRAWYNSDDGFDCISAWESIRFEGCWAFRNGMSEDGKKLADGNGFKVGGFGVEPRPRLPKTIPRHEVERCLAVENKASGFYANHHPGGSDWMHNSAYGNRSNFNFLGRDMRAGRDVPGFEHRIHDNLSFRGRAELQNLDVSRCEMRGNVFGEGLSPMEFISLDPRDLEGQRLADGSLPEIPFLRPVAGSPWVRGNDTDGRDTEGSAPGAFVPRNRE
ncbi:hypothetical protein HNR46_003408 [Haloferula luteola]|uniref:Pel9A-like right handed beta-helix region domain-containing protein n=1 Tax=Haloferula luteola TaxID=595692 RepID=A0A840VC83_9BACT|nr:right-handed parallel beta-helix repeat-containing protein [Haloferula luteola]MBB5353154.1 hypothetical protein [Haloferula luteola]